MLRDRVAATGSAPKVMYLQNHGMFALGASTAEVLQITEMAVKVAEVILGSLPAGGPVFLAAADVARIDTRPDELLRRAALAGANAAPASASAAPASASAASASTPTASAATPTASAATAPASAATPPAASVVPAVAGTTAPLTDPTPDGATR
ncbi:hypothetical protein [Herbiconiux sp. UC225_62]|uniref:hypothetical protein n=1 Tax=Herbiconiux sp. UC225_62 TaxID=3350168 RepID=UPI0036D3D484